MSNAGTVVPNRRRWLVLTTGFFAMAAGCCLQYGPVYLIPELQDNGMSLGEAALISTSPTAGLLLSLFAWGAAADRWGERVVLSVGLGLGGVILLAGTRVHSAPGLAFSFLLAGAASASVHAASGRLILGWFEFRERAFAMAIRQTAQPIGVAIAALCLPLLAQNGIDTALVFLGTFCGVGTVLVVFTVRDPGHSREDFQERQHSPYRTPILWRIHAASALLIVPQFAMATYALVYLVDERSWESAEAGRLLAAVQVGAAASRLVVGWWSDRVKSRLRPLRTLALTITLSMAGLAASMWAAPAMIVILLITASIVTTTTNGLTYTAVAEYAGRTWAGRALGIHNTIQNAVAVLTPPALAVVVTVGGYDRAFAATMIFSLLAAPLVPAPKKGKRQRQSLPKAESTQSDPVPQGS